MPCPPRTVVQHVVAFDFTQTREGAGPPVHTGVSVSMKAETLGELYIHLP